MKDIKSWSFFDQTGKPIKGKLVIASPSETMGQPLFLSDSRTGKNGEYIVRVPEGGIYYVRVKGQQQPVVNTTVMGGEVTKGVNIRLTGDRATESR